MNIFKMASMQLQRERKTHSKIAPILLIRRAVKIRHYLDIMERNSTVLKNRYEK